MLWIRDVKKAVVSSMGRCTAEMITRRRGHGTRSSSTHINSGEEMRTAGSVRVATQRAC